MYAPLKLGLDDDNTMFVNFARASHAAAAVAALTSLESADWAFEFRTRILK